MYLAINSDYAVKCLDKIKELDYTDRQIAKEIQVQSENEYVTEFIKNSKANKIKFHKRFNTQVRLF